MRPCANAPNAHRGYGGVVRAHVIPLQSDRLELPPATAEVRRALGFLEHGMIPEGCSAEAIRAALTIERLRRSTAALDARAG